MADEDEITAPLEAEALQAGWAVKAAAHPRCHAYLAVGGKTDLGQVRENNEDKFDFLEPDDPSVLARKGRVFAVADGMGGHSAGQVASELALKIFIRSFYSDANPDMEASLRKAVREANAYVVDVARSVSGRSGMGATLTAAIIRDDDLYLAQVGDSRCYLLRGGELRQVTEDHSWVAEQVRAGAMTEAEAEQSPFRNVITRSMGGAPDVEPDVLAVKLEVGDRYLLCSDGLSGMAPAEEIAQVLGGGSPSVAAWNLVDRANEYGGKDNITALVIQVIQIDPWPGAEEVESEEAVEYTTEVFPVEEAPVNGHHADAGTSGTAPTAQQSGVEGAGAEARGGFLDKIFRRT